MADTKQQSIFSVVAQKSTAFTFLLRDRGQRFPFFTVRNGAQVACTGELTLFLPPEDLIREQPARNAVTQTPSGSWTDSFGNGLPRWTLKGTTGWRARAARGGVVAQDNRQDGYTAFHVFFDLIKLYLDENQSRAFEAAQAGRVLLPLVQLIFHDHTDDEWWIIEPDGPPAKTRSFAKPNMYEYEFKFTGIRQLTERAAAVSDPNGQAVVGSETRYQKISDVLSGAIVSTQAAIDEWATAAKQNPADAAKVDAIMQKVVDGEEIVASGDLIQEDVDLILKQKASTNLIFKLPEEELPTDQTLLGRCKQMMAGAKELGTALTAWRQQASSFIAMPFAKATALMGGVRDIMNSIALSYNAFILTAQLRSALRQLRTQLRNLWCAGQSLLSFPYNFVQGLKASLQSFLDLFKLSGCATTFPRVKGLSWGGAQKTVIPSP